MKTYKVKIADSEIEIKQDDDGLFIKPDIMLATSGIGSALKPAVEPITIARKPISEKTLVDNFVKWGVGGINIDQCRVGLIDGVDDSQLRTMNRSAKSEENGWGMNQKSGDNPQVVSPQGRFPANLIHDGSDEVLDLFPNTGKSSGGGKASASTNEGRRNLGYGFGKRDDLPDVIGFGDSGSAARFFYCAKASKSERNMGCDGLEEKSKTEEYAGRDTRCSVCGKFFLSTTNPCECSEEEFGAKSTRIQNPTNKNNHPTVKPIALMEYLIKLVSREGHTILDPFMGSGSTGIACKKLNRHFIGIEREPDYITIAENRIEAVPKTLF